jgi:hypothetical protein
MSAPLPRGPTDRVEKIRSANASRIKQREENLLKEFAHLMGADVKAVRLPDRAAGDALGGAQTSPPPVIAVDQPAKQRRTDPSFPISVVDAALVSKKTSSKFRGDVLAVRSSYPHEGGTFASAPSTGRRRWGRANVVLTILFVIGAGGFFGAWALNAAPDARIATPVDSAADGSAKALASLREAISASDSSASVLPLNQAGKQDQVNLAPGDDRSSEPLPHPRSAPTSPDPSNAEGPNPISSVPAARSITPADAPSVPPTTVGQAADSADNPRSHPDSRSLPESKDEKMRLVRLGGSVPDDSGSSKEAIQSLKPAEAPALPPPPPALPDRAPVPPARPLSQAPANIAPQPLAHKTGVLSKSSSKSIDRKPTPKVRTTMGSPLRPLDVATAPGSGAATAPEVAKAPRETGTSAESLLQFVPSLFDKGVSAVRNFVGNGASGG